MGKKRKLDATIDESALEDTTDEPRKGGMGGMWAGSAMNMLKQRIDDAHGSLVDGLKAGTVVIKLKPEQIEDSVGSDRLTAWEKDEDFLALVANIKRRGQKQPIRVRPKVENWEPDPSNPLISSDKFYIQSGRRRLAACEKLGIPVDAIISTEQGNLALSDLEERFHENTMRRALNGFEELVSIGLLASSLKELTQTEIAERLGVAQGDVSLGLACLEHREVILGFVDVANTPKRAYRSILPKVKRGELLGHAAQENTSKRPVRTFDTDGVKIVATRDGKSFAFNVKSDDVMEDDIGPIFLDIFQAMIRVRQEREQMGQGGKTG